METTRPSSPSIQALPTSRPRGAYAQPDASRHRPRLAWLVLLTLGILLVAPLAAFAYVQGAGLILPGISVAGFPVAGRTTAQAAEEIDRIWNRDYRLVAADTGDPTRAWVVPPAEFGLSVDPQATAAQALAVGRGQGLVPDLLRLLSSVRETVEIQPVVVLDPVVARSALEAWAGRIEIPPVDGVLEIAASALTASPGLAGRRLDVQASLELLAADPAGAMLDYAVVPLVTAPLPPAVGDVSAAAAQAESILSRGVQLNLYDPYSGETFAWEPPRPEIAGWLRALPAQGALALEIDEAALAVSVDAFNAALSDARYLDPQAAVTALRDAIQGLPNETLIVHRHPTEYVVGPGETLTGIGYRLGMPAWVIARANPQLGGAGVRPGETITLPPPDVMYPLPVVADRRIVISIAEQHLWAYQAGGVVRDEVISTGMSGSATLPGVFQVQSHYLNAYGSNWDLWMPHFLGIYEALPDFWNGIHGLPLLSSGVRLWADVLGRPASFGCIILDLEAAEWIYGWAEDGVIVEIRR